jgi:leader peptidase (prepilin peptidase)/N-methyltransferase
MSIYIFVFIFGSVIGSFLNVCIYRIPRDSSIVFPSSHCPSCGSPIKFYDNIPILSYIILMGRCRACKAKISARYPLVEFLNGVLYVLTLYKFGSDSIWTVLAYFIFLSALIVITFIDIDFQIIPDSITLPGIPVALILGSILMPDPFEGFGYFQNSQPLGFKASLIGMISGGGFFYLVAVLGKALLKKDAMGGGDIKMMAMVGALMGWKSVILTTFLASLLGSIIGILLIAVKGREWGSRIPFGPYLALGSVITLFYGHELLMWYLYLG